MTLFEIVHILKQIALTQPNVRSTTDGSIYDALNATNSVKYDVVHFSQTKHIEDYESDTYGFNIFYVSRLEDSLEDNRLQIQSIGKEVLGNILRSFCENWSIDFPEIIYYPYTQKFADLCAGVYCKVEIEVPKELLCPDDYIDEVAPRTGIKLENIRVEIDQNGTREVTPSPGFDGIGKVTIVTDVTGGSCNLEYKEVEYTENGEYTILPSSGYDGLSEVAVSISVPQGQGYEEGYADGEAAQKAKLTVTSFTENNTYTREDGWSAVTVNVPSDYQDGYDDGVADQKAKLSTTSVTENGTYTREDGYSAITVNVDDRYDEGYADGFAAGASACSGYFITALTLNVDSAITDSGTATTTYSPVTAITDIYYTSSDPSIATIDSGTGIITVLSSGTVTICAKDSITHLQDCKTVSVFKTELPYLTLNIISGGTIRWFATNANYRKTIYYKKNNSNNWVSITSSTAGTSFNVNTGEIVKFKGDNLAYGGNASGAVGEYYNSFSGSTAKFSVEGNIMSLIDSTGFMTLKVLSGIRNFECLFRGCTGLTSVENLELPATTLAPACYTAMFYGCTSLTTAPALPANTLANWCYSSMFSGCTSLTTAPELPATTLVDGCYADMFYGCSSLIYIKCLATDISASNCTAYWTNGVASEGTFVKNPNMSSWTRGNNGVPSGWTITNNT